MLTLIITICALLGGGVVAYELHRRSQLLRGFDGPVGLPIVGNLWHIGTDAAETYRQWAKRYGAVYQIQLGSIPVIVVNSAAAAKTLFGHNQSAMSSRPEFYTFHKIVSDTSGTTLGTAPFNDSLKRRRKIAASALNKSAVQTYVSQLDMETRIFISDLYHAGQHGTLPLNPIPMIQRLNMSLTLTMNWGRRMETQQNALFPEITHVEDEISKFRRTNANLQDYIPLLRLNPFSADSAKAREYRSRRDKYMNTLDAELHEKIAAGTEKPCIQVSVLREGGLDLTKREMTSINVTMLAAGLDTMISAVSWGMVCLAARPEIQVAALKAIREHFPASQPLCDAADDQGCEYIVGLVKEILRFYTMARLNLPRRSVKDVTYEGKLIPAGSILFLNAWACNHDPLAFPDPDVFRPERWLSTEDGAEPPQHFTLGLGSRMCIGIHLAYRELYLIFIRLINSFELVAEGEIDCDALTGQEDPVALTVQPKGFRVRFVARDGEALAKAVGES